MNKPPVNKDVAKFLQKVANLPPQKNPLSSSENTAFVNRLIFALDATASRQPTWDRACHIQADMFQATQGLSQLQLQLCYYRGYNDFFSSDWVNQQQLSGHMQSVQCLGGYTQIERLLKHCLTQIKQKKGIKGVVFIGDCIEENIETLCNLAGQLSLHGVPLFIFHEGDDKEAALAFQHMATMTAGAYCPFNQQSPEQLKLLLEAITVYAAGGAKALQAFSRRYQHASIKKLVSQLKLPPA